MVQSSVPLVGNIYLVRWKDSGTHHADGWQTREEILEAAEIETVTSLGYCFQTTPDSVYLAQTWDSSKTHFFGTQVIQTSNIISQHALIATERLTEESYEF